MFAKMIKNFMRLELVSLSTYTRHKSLHWMMETRLSGQRFVSFYRRGLNEMSVWLVSFLKIWSWIKEFAIWRSRKGLQIFLDIDTSYLNTVFDNLFKPIFFFKNRGLAEIWKPLKSYRLSIFMIVFNDKTTGWLLLKNNFSVSHHLNTGLQSCFTQVLSIFYLLTTVWLPGQLRGRRVGKGGGGRGSCLWAECPSLGCPGGGDGAHHSKHCIHRRNVGDWSCTLCERLFVIWHNTPCRPMILYFPGNLHVSFSGSFQKSRDYSLYFEILINLQH